VTEPGRATRPMLLAVLVLALGLALGGCGVVHRGPDAARSPGASRSPASEQSAHAPVAPAPASPTSGQATAGSPAAAPIRQDDLTGLTQSLSDAAALDDEVGTDMAADAGESSS